MRVSVVAPQELAEGDLALWRRYLACDPSLASPYLRPEFAQLVAAVRSDARVAVVEEAGAVCAFFPFQRRGRVGMPIAGGLSDCQAVIAAPGWEWDARALVRAAGLSVFDFTAMRAGQHPFAPFHRKVAASYLIELAEGGFDAYVHERRRSGYDIVAKTLSDARRLGQRIGPLRFAMHDPDPQTLHRLIEWKRRQYRATGALDVFAHPWTVALLERLQATQTEGFAGVLSTLRAGDRIVAAHMGMRSPTVLHYWFPAYDEAYAKFAPGRILLLELIRAASAAGIEAIELGPGEEGYKHRFANGAVPVAAGHVGSASLLLLCRRLRHLTEAVARRLPIGPARQWPATLFHRIEWEWSHR